MSYDDWYQRPYLDGAIGRMSEGRKISYGFYMLELAEDEDLTRADKLQANLASGLREELNEMYGMHIEDPDKEARK